MQVVDIPSVVISSAIGGIGGIIGASSMHWGIQCAFSTILSVVNDIGTSLVQDQKINIKDVIVNAVISACSSAIASSLTYSARANAEKTIKNGVGRVTRGIGSMSAGSRYWKGAIKRGIKIVQNGVRSLNIAQGQSSTIASSISFAITNIKAF